MVRGQHLPHGAPLGRGAALAQIAGDRRSQRSLMRSKSIQLRIRDDVLRMAVVSLVVHELADIAQHRGRLQPDKILRRQFMYFLQVAKELCRVIADWLRQLGIDPVAPARLQYTFPSFAFKNLMDWRALV